MTNSKQSLSVENLLYERKWLIEQLAGAWGWTEETVERVLTKDTAAHRSRSPLEDNSNG